MHRLVFTSPRVLVVLNDFFANCALKLAAYGQLLQRNSFVLSLRFRYFKKTSDRSSASLDSTVKETLRNRCKVVQQLYSTSILAINVASSIALMSSSIFVSPSVSVCLSNFQGIFDGSVCAFQCHPMSVKVGIYLPIVAN